MNLIVLLGPTSSGKSELAVSLAQSLDKCVIVNCDSRQIYRGLDIGTGKVEGKWLKTDGRDVFVYKGIPHYLIDYVDPATPFSLADYIRDWIGLPFFGSTYTDKPDWVILVGGTGLWAKAILEEYQLTSYSDALLSELLRAYSNKSLFELQDMYSRSNLKPLNNSDHNNPRRLVNKLADAASLNMRAPTTVYPHVEQRFVFALDIPTHKLHHRIRTRLHARIDTGILQEVESLLRLGDRLLDLGLEYRVTYMYLLGLYTEDE